MTELLGAREIRELAESLGIRPTKKLGQNFVIDPNTVQRIVRAADVVPTDHVLEVGPGLGSLTLALLQEVSSVIAIEIDPVLAEQLPRTIALHMPERAQSLTLIVSDAMKVDVVPGEPTALVANLPYNVSVPVLLHLLEVVPTIRTALVMVQKEVAERLAADPGSRTYGIPSLKARWYGEVRMAGNIGRNVFWPEPNVDSALVRVDRREQPTCESSREWVFKVIDTAFAQRRKSLRGALAQLAGSPDAAEQALRSAGIDPGRRGEALTLPEFIALADSLYRALADENAYPQAMAPTSVIVRVPAKVNLQLSVGPLRKDGYHELATVFHAVSLSDEVKATYAEPGAGITLTISGEGSDHLPVDESNLAYRAAMLLAAHAGIEADVTMHLNKGIPVAGGMAGGSADAAGALVACDALWRLGTDRDDLMDLAAELGSDVPFALHGGTAVGTGRGEKLMSALARGSFHWVFALADGGLSTPAVYGECDRLREGIDVPDPYVSDLLMQGLRAGDAVILGKALGNDLQAAAISLRPSLAQVLETGDDLGALGGIVSGSGPTCAFLARDHEHALDIAVGVTSAGVCRTVKTATSPAHGAKVVG